MILNVLLLIFGALCVVYDFFLILMNPGTFLDNLTCFSHVWSVLGGYHIFLGVYRIKKGHSFWKTFKRWIKLTLVSLTSIGAAISLINLFYICNPVVTDFSAEADYVVLLGGGIDKDGKLPESVLNRVETAKKYLELHPKAICVVTGGTLKWLPFAEAPEIKRQLVVSGINEERILVEDQALDTIQNFQYSCKMLADFQNISKEEVLNQRCIVVTNGFHLRRAERLAARMGFKKVQGISAKCPVLLIPHSYMREICAYVKLNMRILLTGKPEHI